MNCDNHRQEPPDPPDEFITAPAELILAVLASTDAAARQTEAGWIQNVGEPTPETSPFGSPCDSVTDQSTRAAIRTSTRGAFAARRMTSWRTAWSLPVLRRSLARPTKPPAPEE